MGEFTAAKRRFVVHLRTEDLHEALVRAESNGHVSIEAVADALSQLVEWGNLRADHGDFDWGGVRIGNVLHARLPLVPWRFDTAAYLSAADSVASSQPLIGSPVPASWDPRLSEMMRRAGRRIEEELVVEELLADLAA